MTDYNGTGPNEAALLLRSLKIQKDKLSELYEETAELNDEVLHLLIERVEAVCEFAALQVDDLCPCAVVDCLYGSDLVQEYIDICHDEALSHWDRASVLLGRMRLEGEPIFDARRIDD